MTVITMSRTELSRLRVMIDLADGRTRVEDAAALMGLQRRQVYRLLDAFRTHGPDALISKRRGKPSNRAHGAAFRQTCLAIVRERYEDFGPTLAAEKLAEIHGLPIGVETLRQWMIDDGIWVRRRDRIKRIHQPRHRRDCLGELVQVDGCEHWWFEDRGPQCTLLVFVDDATSRLMHLSFVASESAFAYFQAARTYLEDHGKPIALYSDKHSVFRTNKPEQAEGGMTQFGRALHELNIDILCANAPQAKGRVERARKTLQDRLVKELRLAGAHDIEAGNALLPAFMADYNRRFAKPAPERQGSASAARAARRSRRQLRLARRKNSHPVADGPVRPGDVHPRAERDHPRAGPQEGHRLRFPGRPDRGPPPGPGPAYRTFDRITRVDQGAIVENKRLSEALEMCRAMQAELPPKLRSRKAPARTAQAEHMFEVR
jgi:hypothetical protein